jgi:hypothetical protein
LGGRGRRISEFKASLVYRVCSRIARATHRNSVLKKQNKSKPKRKKKKNTSRMEDYVYIYTYTQKSRYGFTISRTSPKKIQKRYFK